MNAYYDGSCIILNKDAIEILRTALKAQACNLRAMLSHFEGHAPLQDLNGVIQQNIQVCEHLNVMLALLQNKAKASEVTRITLSEPQTTLFPTEPFPTPSPDNAKALDKVNDVYEIPAPTWTPPANCRERLRLSGQPYPRSSCGSCGGMSPNSRVCVKTLEQERGK